MNFEWLFSFVAFAERLNFTHAAADLHISQPALHVQIKKLSEDLGFALYEKRGRALHLTEEGMRLAAFGRSVQGQETDLLAELRAQPPGPVTLAAGHGAFLHLLGPVIKRFPKSRWPLRLLTLPGPEAIAAVRDARAQLGVAVIDGSIDDLVAHTLHTFGQKAVMLRSHALAKRRRLAPRDLCGHELVLAPEGRPHRLMIEHAMRSEGAELVVGVEASGWELMLEFARDGMGVAIVNDLCRVPRGCAAVPMPCFPRQSYVLVHRKRLSEGATYLAELLRSGVG